MAVLSFKVQADYEKVVRLREEIAKLENAQDGCRHTELKEIIMEITGKKMSTAKTLIKQALQAHIIFKSCDKYYLSRCGSNLGQI